MVSQLRGDEPYLELGASGEGVQELQFRLYRLGYYRQFPDGTYNMTTEDAVRELQSSHGQSPTGEVTSDTWAAIVYWEQQQGLEYQYSSAWDALTQLRYDLEHPQRQYAVNEVSPDGQWRYNGTEWVAAEAPAQHVGQVSADGQWRWDGSDWVAASANPHADEISPDGQWRWDGTDWVAASASDHVGRLSPDGYYRWSGTDWVVA